MNTVTDKRAPMAAAPMKYNSDGSVDWGNMWDTFCVLAREGGPPHRGTMLQPEIDSDVTSDGYRFAVHEICRGILEVSGLRAEPDSPAGWIAISCASAGMARWLAEAIVEENVQARHDGSILFVPVGEHYALKGEVKNVITAVAKTTHYWKEHLPAEIQSAMKVEEQLGQMTRWLAGLFRRPRST